MLQTLEVEEVGLREWGPVTSGGSSGVEVTWQQAKRFMVRRRREASSSKGELSSSSSLSILDYLQQEGVLRILIGSLDDGWPAFRSQFPLRSLTC